MYKLKYYSLDKISKNKIKEEFYQTDFGKNIKTRLDRLLIIGILGIIFGIFLIITYQSIWELSSGITLIIASIFFILGSFKVRIKKINDYLVKSKK